MSWKVDDESIKKMQTFESPTKIETLADVSNRLQHMEKEFETKYQRIWLLCFGYVIFYNLVSKLFF